MAKEKQIGEITHYFGKIGVGVVELTHKLSVGDKIHIVGGTRDFEQTVESMQIEHENVDKAGKREAVGLKLDQVAKEGDKVYRVKE